MTAPFERTLVFILVGDFLESLRAAPDGGIPEIIRAQANGLLRHYQSTFEIGHGATMEEHRATEPSSLFDPRRVPPHGKQGGYRR